MQLSIPPNARTAGPPGPDLVTVSAPPCHYPERLSLVVSCPQDQASNPLQVVQDASTLATPGPTAITDPRPVINASPRSVMAAVSKPGGLFAAQQRCDRCGGSGMLRIDVQSHRTCMDCLGGGQRLLTSADLLRRAGLRSVGSASGAG